MTDTTYDRKYYLIREIKKAGFELVKSEVERIIIVPFDKERQARLNKYVRELQNKYNYGIQLTIA